MTDVIELFLDPRIYLPYIAGQRRKEERKEVGSVVSLDSIGVLSWSYGPTKNQVEAICYRTGERANNSG